MTKVRMTFAAALGFMVAGLVAATPVSAGSLNIAKPVVTVDQHVDLLLVDRGSWHQKKRFSSKKHYRGNHFDRHDSHFKGHKKKYKRAYRSGYRDGYYDGRYADDYYDRGYYGRGYGHHDGYRPRFRSRGHYDGRGHRFGSGYIKTPGFYFRF